MKNHNIINPRSYTGEEMNEKFGGHLRYNVGDCFKMENLGGIHYFMQREKDFLHVKDGIINNVHNSTLDNEEIIKISQEEFLNKIKNVIFELGIYEYVINKK